MVEESKAAAGKSGKGGKGARGKTAALSERAAKLVARMSPSELGRFSDALVEAERESAEALHGRLGKALGAE